MSHYPPTRLPPSSPPVRRDSTRVWAGITFATLSLCCLGAMLVIATGGQIPRWNRGPSWVPPTITPELAASAPAAQPPDRSDDQPFLPGDEVQNVSGGPVNLRLTPGYQNKPADDVLGTVSAGSAGIVQGGPQQVDGLRWWQVQFVEGQGWMAERSSSGKVLLDLNR